MSRQFRSKARVKAKITENRTKAAVFEIYHLSDSVAVVRFCWVKCRVSDNAYIPTSEMACKRKKVLTKVRKSTGKRGHDREGPCQRASPEEPPWAGGSVCVLSLSGRLRFHLSATRLVQGPTRKLKAFESSLRRSPCLLRSRDPDAHRSDRRERGSPAAQRSEQPGPTEARRGGRGAISCPLRRSISEVRNNGGSGVFTGVFICPS